MFNTILQEDNYEYIPKIIETEKQPSIETTGGLYSIRVNKLIEGVFKKVNKIRGNNNVLTPLIPKEGKNWENIMELGCGDGKSFDKLLENIGQEVKKIIFIEGNKNSIEKFKEKLKNKKYDKIRDKIHFINTDLGKREGLENISSELKRLNIEKIDFIYAKAFIHHLFTQEQKDLFDFLRDYMGKNSFIYLYNQFTPKDISELKHNLVITNVLNIITDYFIKLNKIKEEKGLLEAKKETQKIKKEATKQLFLHLIKIFGAKTKSLFTAYDFSKYSIELFDDFIKKLEYDIGVKNIEETIETFFNLYAQLFTSEINIKEHSKYNIQTINHLTQILKESGMDTEIFDGSLWSKGVMAKLKK